MKKISYSQDVDALLVELSNEPISYAEDDGQVILHYSDHEKLVLIEILDFKKFFRLMQYQRNCPVLSHNSMTSY